MSPEKIVEDKAAHEPLEVVRAILVTSNGEVCVGKRVGTKVESGV